MPLLLDSRFLKAIESRGDDSAGRLHGRVAIDAVKHARVTVVDVDRWPVIRPEGRA
jgi:hypothetical protein